MNDSKNPTDKYINDPELARPMAHAELPYQMVRQAAEAKGLPEEAKRQAQLANTAGVVAGRAYIESLKTEAEDARRSADIVIKNLSQEVDAGVEQSTVAITPETEEKPNPWSEIDPTKLEKARKAQEALANKYEHLGAKPEDFIPVFTKSDLEDVDGKPVRDKKGNIIQVDHTTVAYAGTKRLDLGNPVKNYDPARSWNTVMSNDEKNVAMHTIDIDGQQIDTRKSTTLAVLKQVAASNPEIYEWAWRTGEPELAGRGSAPIASLGDGRVYDFQVGRGSDGDVIGLRPAVEIV